MYVDDVGEQHDRVGDACVNEVGARLPGPPPQLLDCQAIRGEEDRTDGYNSDDTAEAISDARVALGRELAALRGGAGYSQKEFAPLTGFSRSTLANVEIGRQNVPRVFWARAAEALNAPALIAGHDQIEALVVARRENAARRAQAQRDAVIRNWRHRQPAGSDIELGPSMTHVPPLARSDPGQIDIWLTTSIGIGYHAAIPLRCADPAQIAAVVGNLMAISFGDDTGPGDGMTDRTPIR